MSGIDFSELLKRAIKYIVEGIMVAIAAFAIPKKQLNVEEVVIIALTAAATFSVLDVFVPSMASSARGGAGFGIGADLGQRFATAGRSHFFVFDGNDLGQDIGHGRSLGNRANERSIQAGPAGFSQNAGPGRVNMTHWAVAMAAAAPDALEVAHVKHPVHPPRPR